MFPVFPVFPASVLPGPFSLPSMMLFALPVLLKVTIAAMSQRGQGSQPWGQVHTASTDHQPLAGEPARQSGVVYMMRKDTAAGLQAARRMCRQRTRPGKWQAHNRMSRLQIKSLITGGGLAASASLCEFPWLLVYTGKESAEQPSN